LNYDPTLNIILFAFAFIPIGILLTIGAIEMIFPGSMIFRREPKGLADPD